MNPGKHIILIGFSGSGKSTVGPRLAARMSRTFVDVDQLIETKTGQTIPQIFFERGEKAFRRLEIQSIKATLKRQRPLVMALGGGAFESREIRQAAGSRALVVYLSCSCREIYRRLKGKADRPLLAVKPARGQTPRQAKLARIGVLLKKRLANYRTADLVVSTTGKSPTLITRQLLQWIAER